VTFLSARIERRREGLSLALVALAVAAAYSGTLRVPWYLDDSVAIVRNPLVADLPGAAAALFSPRGLAQFTFALNHRAGGLEPAGFHAVNIAIHVVGSLLAFLLMKRVFVRAPWAALPAALVFALHPLQTQAVTYTVQRMSSLSGCLSLAAVYLFVRSRELLAEGRAFRSPRHLGAWAGSVAAGGLALMAKESAAVLPLQALLFARFFVPRDRERWRPLILSLLPLLVLPSLLGIRSVLGPLLVSGKSLGDLAPAETLMSLKGNTPLRYLCTQFGVLWAYLGMFLLPVGQALDHDYPLVRETVSAGTLLPLAGHCLLGGAAWRMRRHLPEASFGIAWFYASLAVESTVIPLDPMVEHRLYLPLFGLSAAALGLFTAIPGIRVRQAVVTAAVVALAFATWSRNALWADPAAFLEDNLRKAPASERVHDLLGAQYMEAGRFDEAERCMRRGLELNPHYRNLYANLSSLYLFRGREADAMAVLEEGIRRYPREAIFYNNLAMLHARRGDHARVDELLGRAVENDPRFAGAYVNLGMSALATRRFAEAERRFGEALREDGDDPKAHAGLAEAYAGQGRIDAAISELRIAARLDPGDPAVQERLRELTNRPR
jgi:Tfp pilus assembly protein PilF